MIEEVSSVSEGQEVIFMATKEAEDFTTPSTRSVTGARKAGRGNSKNKDVYRGNISHKIDWQLMKELQVVEQSEKTFA